MAEPYKSKPFSTNPLDYAGKDFLDFIHRLDLSVEAYILAPLLIGFLVAFPLRKKAGDISFPLLWVSWIIISFFGIGVLTFASQIPAIYIAITFTILAAFPFIYHICPAPIPRTTVNTVQEELAERRNLACPFVLWCAKILSSRLWTITHPPATIHTKEYIARSCRGTLWL